MARTRKTSVKLAWAGEVPAYDVLASPGLVVNKFYDSVTGEPVTGKDAAWHITHKPSGLKLSMRLTFRKKDEAVAVCEAIAHLCDWDKDAGAWADNSLYNSIFTTIDGLARV